MITGGAGGIGAATAARYLAEGTCVMLADTDAETLRATRDTLTLTCGPDVLRTVAMDVTDEAAVARAFVETAVEFGGVDIPVSNAGIASSAPIEETSLAHWNRNMDILSTRLFPDQPRGLPADARPGHGRRGAEGLGDLGRRMAGTARGHPSHRQGRAGRDVPPTLDTEAAIAALTPIPISVHCWQGDDVTGFETGTGSSGGGIQATGNHPGCARTPDERDRYQSSVAQRG